MCVECVPAGGCSCAALRRGPGAVHRALSALCCLLSGQKRERSEQRPVPGGSGSGAESGAAIPASPTHLVLQSLYALRAGGEEVEVIPGHFANKILSDLSGC